MQRYNPFREKASALVTTLLVITLLTIIVVAFLQSMSLERRTAQSFSNAAKAQMAADAATDEAMVTLRQLFTSYPDSATGWLTNMAPTSSTNQTPGTVFYYFDDVTVTNTNFTSIDPSKFHARPLVSGAVSVVIPNGTNAAALVQASAMAGVTNLTNWVNLNSTNLLGGKAWVGQPPGATNAPHIDLPWVEIYNGTDLVSRYAYWIEDESFRVNLDTSTNVTRASTSLGTNASEIPIQGLLRSYFPSLSDADLGLIATNIVNNVRAKLPFNGSLQSLKNINFADQNYTNLSDTIGFGATIYSSAANVSRSGARRVNLNAIVSPNTPYTASGTIQREVNSIVATLTNQVPLFGQRFYRTTASQTNSPGVTTGTAGNATIYDYKIAANIRDYIDNDSVPTVIAAGGAVMTSNAPTRALGRLGQVNPAWAIGKENVPRLQETVFRAEQLSMAGTSADSTYNVHLTYYLEFWNMGTRDIVLSDTPVAGKDVLPADTYLSIANQTEWVRQDGQSRFVPGDFKIPLSQFVNVAGSSATNTITFKAGELTVISTTQRLTSGAITIPTTVYRPNANWTPSMESPPFFFTGTVERNPATSGFSGLGTLMTKGRDGPNGGAVPTAAEDNWDAETEVSLGCSSGWVESRLGSVVIRPGIYVDSFSTSSPNQKANANFHWRGGGLMGNVATGMFRLGTPSQVGDPRASNEQLTFTAANYEGLGADQTDFSRTRGNANAQSKYVSTDYSSMSLGAMNPSTQPLSGSPPWDEANNSRTINTLANGGSPAYYRNDAMRSTAELGHIYDPTRGVVSGNVTSMSGGARTLHIGSGEATPTPGSSFAMWDGNLFSASARWAAWRLLDIFSITDTPINKGVINPNGALRDNGAAIRAALEGFSFSGSDDQTDKQLKNKVLPTAAIAQLASSLTNYLANPNKQPFFERGQLGELDFFNNTDITGMNLVVALTDPYGLRGLNDRGREELFRRMAEMFATKGNTFSVYAIGQSLKVLPNGTVKPLATTTRKVTFRLLPQYANTNTTFDPSDSASVAQRFASPTNYAIQVLSQSE